MLSSIKKSISSVYLLYELNTCIYMLDPWEKKFINGVIFSILALLIFSSYVYLPSYTRRLIGAFLPATTEQLTLDRMDHHHHHHHQQTMDFGVH
ncbi:serine palmitoyltransferase small subunit A-like [Topomyia yanbarensis]|uniref:serine palmitoyltransferase small subunit A-like n=1 Tax=Topomyia yanbarensis TaxID=2498891 RepID=UPI00273B194A|nr:serine palmitoyltransferase small subunit A-like [Topomyia yanbarensis]